ncbi:penicillin-binding protein [Psychroserpens sp.]|uniref:penicillin-binding protein n=1 Tax=Psychroserpens sp. TaxID=2020870 RepID=UPI001B17D566|nr:penicillin-binding protein [Psychroserpens sp.]MBO6605855.1 transpeptidase family protein [Psychroserpens sp.]MBO6630916.1 transpeptidase family protein [Psychroserpens sp.]MBO6652774.1 transpeptidase family protein [Psychroserpens sp.]MBO6681454.1 transpeptidase family protein [Psychroserpens sp.]MBO6749229.1 transpeptidase family protein [Psychroserpens sp.]
MFVFALAVVFKLCSIQFIQGDQYRSLAEERIVKNVEIPANRGNVYSADGSLLATSIPKYDIRLDAIQPKDEVFNKYIKALGDSLSNYSGKPSSYHQNTIKKARKNKNRYFLLARNISYSDYIRLRNFPLLELGAIRGGLIVEQTTRREHPMGGIAERTIGYEKIDEDGNVTRPGIDGYFGVDYLRGKNGKRLKQKIGNGQWKPIVDYNQVEPQDGYDVYTTIDVNIQDIAHHSLLGQLEKYEADHGCAVVMDVKTGEIKAISNLGRNKDGEYYERLNYAVGESHEPGSTFKVMAIMAALEDKVIDTSTIVDTQKGTKRFYGRTISDTRGYGEISAAKALEVSSNIGLATIVDEHYSDRPKKFINRVKSWSLHEPLGVTIIGEGKPIIPEPGDKIWSKNALPSMAYGYNLQMTPLQTLAFYNAIANDGEMVKPRFIKAVKEFDREIETFDKEVINQKICSDKTLREIQEILKNVVLRGTGRRMYSKNFSMAGKTGTARTDYNNYEEWLKDRKYVSSFAGYFPVENPKYSCIVVIHKPSTKVGYYGADVSGPVFKRIAQKIYTETPLIDEIETLEVVSAEVEAQYESFYNTAQKYKTIMPDVIGLPTMDALALLENMGLKVKVEGIGMVKSQSINKGIKVKPNEIVVLSS